MGNEGEEAREPIFRDIRRYYCDYCGISRSKKSLISSHMLTHHEDEISEKKSEGKGDGEKVNTCQECGGTFRKPAYLKQHMQSHSFERPFACPVNDCNSSYRRKDHLSRHMLTHQDKYFECPIQQCKRKFTFLGNMTRHMKEFHGESSKNVEHPQEYICPEPGCGKAFKYPSKLRKHEDSHVKLDTVEAYCSDPRCMKYFTNEKCLKEHIFSCHQYTDCHICGCKQLRKNLKRHLRKHEGEVPSERVKCSYDGCSRSFATKSNLNQHIKAAHLELKQFSCSFSGCRMKFSFKHVRDRHEKSGCHVYTLGNFMEADEQFRSRPRGGRKRKYPHIIESLFRKRIVPPSGSDLTDWRS